jgi:hypothetical protein
MNKTSLVVAFFAAAVLAGLFVRTNLLHSLMGGRESFEQKEVGMPLNGGGIGPFDGVSLEGGVSGWAATEGAPVMSSNLGDAAPLPSQSDKSNEFMLLVGNKVDTACCPAAFNTDTGCVCLTEQDKTLFAHRGGNRT